jgi:hypothetical protein
MQTREASVTDTPSYTTKMTDARSSSRDITEEELRSYRADSSQLDTSSGPEYVAVTPTLWVEHRVGIVDRPKTLPDGVVAVRSFNDARAVLRHILSMPECCVDDRISVAMGGPVTCAGH